MFSYVWLHFKKCFEKYFLVFGCVLENSIENTFSTCCSHFLTFSRLPNEYIISFIPQYRTQTKPRKKSSNPVTFSHIFSVAKQQKHKHSGQIQKHKYFLGSTRGCDQRGALRNCSPSSNPENVCVFVFDQNVCVSVFVCVSVVWQPRKCEKM